jgi:hypothetical protein
MEILKETESATVNWECDFTEEEYNALLDFAKRNIPEQKLNELLIEWAVIKALETFIEEKTDGTLATQEERRSCSESDS